MELKFLTRIVAIIILASMPLVFSDSTQDARTVAEKLTQIFQNYDKQFRPNHGGAAVEVALTGYVLAMPEIDSTKQELVLDFYFRQAWNDPRLAFQGYNEQITLTAEYVSKLWRPDTFFTNELSAQEHTVTVPNVLGKISANGDVLMSARYTLRTTCPMNFRYFPFDEQLCALTAESYAFNAKDITYKWAKGKDSFGVSSELSQVAFKVKGHRATATTETFSSGSYSRATIEFRFQRASGRYFSEFFYPCMFLVFLSILTLYVSDTRLALLVNVLTMGFTIVFLAISSGSLETPGVSYATSLDSFSAITNSFVFISFLLSSICMYVSKNMNGQSDGQSDEESIRSNSNIIKQSPLPSSRIEAVGQYVCGLVVKFLPLIRLGLIAVYLFTLLIFWTVAPFAQQTPENAILKDDWVTY